MGRDLFSAGKWVAEESAFYAALSHRGSQTMALPYDRHNFSISGGRKMKTDGFVMNPLRILRGDRGSNQGLP